MARLARVTIPNLPHHITQRGNRRQQTFFCDADYELYLDLLAEWCLFYGVEIWAYCLMPNHTHVIAVLKRKWLWVERWQKHIGVTLVISTLRRNGKVTCGNPVLRHFQWMRLI
ncbi:MAG: transposase [Terasakiella sp.]|uniref:transposase n=1 Tax=unclassified Terasakiella TaxID=2614952 RepID=UPI003B00C805